MLGALFGILFSLLLSGVWIGAALGITGIIIMQIWGGGIVALGSAVWSVLDVYSLSALPGFIFMGQIILESGISLRIYNSVSPLMARLPGKLLTANILICAMFAAVLGASTANAAVVGSVAIPEMRKRKYNERLLLGTLCVGGTLGIMIPPSSAFIIYGVMSNTSIAALFAAGTIPGIIMALLFIAYIVIKGTLTPTIAPLEEKSLPIKPTLISLLRIWPLLLLMFACVGTIYVGWCTAVEGSGIGALASIIMGRIFGKLDWERIKASLIRTTEISAMIFFLFLGAMLLSASVSAVGLPKAIVQKVGELPLSSISIMALIYLMYIIMGCFLDGISMTVSTLPFILPIVASLGVDLIWFGVVLTMLVEIGQITPPVGLNLFVIQGLAGPDTSLSTIFMGSLPFLIITTSLLGLFTFFPEITLFLPRLLGLY
jgi:C4-dicarboxylate transporter DctM subunit